MNLCLYCSKGGHQAKDCMAPPNCQPRGLPGNSLWNMDTILEEQKQDIYPIDDTNLGQLANTAELSLFEAEPTKYETVSF